MKLSGGWIGAHGLINLLLHTDDFVHLWQCRCGVNVVVDVTTLRPFLSFSVDFYTFEIKTNLLIESHTLLPTIFWLCSHSLSLSNTHPHALTHALKQFRPLSISFSLADQIYQSFNLSEIMFSDQLGRWKITLGTPPRRMSWSNTLLEVGKERGRRKL